MQVYVVCKVEFDKAWIIWQKPWLWVVAKLAARGCTEKSLVVYISQGHQGWFGETEHYLEVELLKANEYLESC